VAVILISHNLSEIYRVCNRALVFQKGRLLKTNTLGESILLYQKITHATAHPERESRASSVRLQTVRTLNHLRQPQQAFHSGEDVNVEILYESDIETTDSIFIIKLASAELGEFLSFTNRVAGKRIPIVQGTGRVVVQLRKLPLLAGNYAVQVHLYDAEAKNFWDRAMPACTFDIIEPIPDVWDEFHLLRVDHEWFLDRHISGSVATQS
jgi:hypothetical protein